MKRFAALLAALCLVPAFAFALADPAPADSSSADSSSAATATVPYGAPVVGESTTLGSSTLTVDAEGLELAGEQLSVTDTTAIVVSPEAEALLRDSVVTARASLEADETTDDAQPVLATGVEVADGASVMAIGTTVSARGAAIELEPGAQPGKDVEVTGATFLGSDLSSTASNAAVAGPWRTLNVFGSRLVGSGSGIITAPGTKVAVDTVAAGYNDDALMPLVTSADTERWGDGTTGSTVEGGRNAIVIAGPLAFGSAQAQATALGTPVTAKVAVNGSTLRTDASRVVGTETDKQKQAYLDHAAGSAIAIRSAGADIALDGCFVELDKKGTGYLLQTVPGVMQDDLTLKHLPINVVLRNMSLSGSVAHEDYTRTLAITLFGTRLEGSINYYDRAHWAQVANVEGFSGYCPDDSPDSQPGITVVLRAQSVWVVSGESHVSGLKISADSSLLGELYVNGTKVEAKPGIAYSGDIVIRPVGAQYTDAGAATSSSTADASQASDASKASDAGSSSSASQAGDSSSTSTPEPKVETVHTHQWTLVGENPAGCEYDGARNYICYGCGEEYSDPIPATGHNYVGTDYLPATCETEGYETFTCTNCGDSFTMSHAAPGHYWLVDSYVAPTCEANGSRSYVCMNCGDTYVETLYATGHNWTSSYYLPPTCTDDGLETYICANCGATYYEPFMATGHAWVLTYHEDATCVADGVDEYVCLECGKIMSDTIYAYGHNWVVYPTPGAESITHTYYCTICGYSYTETHYYGDPCWACGYSGPKG